MSRDPRDQGFNGSTDLVSVVVGGCDSEPLPQDLGLTSDNSISAGELGLEESGVEGRHHETAVRVSGSG